MNNDSLTRSIPDDTPQAPRYVGLDVHKRVAEVCILDASGAVVERQRIAVSRSYLETLGKNVLRPTDHVALEATTNSWSVADVLTPYVASVTVSNPVATKAIAQSKVKTDKVDALVLAQLLRCDYLPAVWVPDAATRQLREITSRRAALVGDRTAILNRIHAVLAMRLIESRDRLFSESGLEWLKTLELDEQGRLLIDSDLALLEALQREVAKIDDVLARRGWSDDRVQLLMTLPGVDVAVAQSIAAATGNISRFRDADHFASYLGLCPSTRQSASTCYHGPITKAGRSHTRWMLVQAAQHLGKHPGPLGHFFRKLARKKNRNVAVVASARKLATIAWHMLTKNEPYRYAQPKSTETKLARLRVKVTGQRRKGGVSKGSKAVAKLPGGSRTVKSLSQVYQEQGLPPLSEPATGESRIVRESGAEPFVESLHHSHLIPRHNGKRTSPAN
jgi:transposase